MLRNIAKPESLHINVGRAVRVLYPRPFLASYARDAKTMSILNVYRYTIRLAKTPTHKNTKQVLDILGLILKLY